MLLVWMLEILKQELLLPILEQETLQEDCKHGPSCPIIAITSNEKTYYQLGAAWNVDPVLIKGEETIEKAIEKAILQLREEGILEKGDRIIISGGSKILPDSTSENKVIGGALKI